MIDEAEAVMHAMECEKSEFPIWARRLKDGYLWWFCRHCYETVVRVDCEICGRWARSTSDGKYVCGDHINVLLPK